MNNGTARDKDSKGAEAVRDVRVKTTTRVYTCARGERTRSVLRNDELQAVALGHDADLLHRLHDIMRATVLDLRPLVARADSDDCRARGDARLDARRRVLKDNAALRVEPELLRGEQERVRGGLPSLETLVASG